MQGSTGSFYECVAKLPPAYDCASLNCLPETVCELMQGSTGSFYECVANYVVSTGELLPLFLNRSL